ncbi:hypothetical protein, partial [Bacillus thuringiensis]|uniref:hypothetical protein n=1 Tax=Bacillus thuringiensis TaxID=1428 RepID=UPI001C3E9E65
AILARKRTRKEQLNMKPHTAFGLRRDEQRAIVRRLCNSMGGHQISSPDPACVSMATRTRNVSVYRDRAVITDEHGRMVSIPFSFGMRAAGFAAFIERRMS